MGYRAQSMEQSAEINEHGAGREAQSARCSEQRTQTREQTVEKLESTVEGIS